LTSFVSSLEQPPPAWGYSDGAVAPMSMGLGRVLGRLLKQIIWRRWGPDPPVPPRRWDAWSGHTGTSRAVGR